MRVYEEGISDLHHKIRKIMRRKRWWKPSEVQRQIALHHDKLYSESTITRRIREMKDVENKPAKGSWLYGVVR